MFSNKSAPSLWLISIAALAIALVVFSVSLNLILDNGQEDLLPNDTPQGIVQRYLMAIADYHTEEAYNFLTENAQDSCGFESFLQTIEYQRNREFSARLIDTVDLENRKLVSVEISEPNNAGPFDGGGYSFETRFTLEEQDGEWWISELPWPAEWCPPERNSPTPEPTPDIVALNTGSKV